MKDPGNPKLHELIHRVAMCSQKDVVVSSSVMELRRKEVVWTWARIKSHLGLPSFLGQAGYTIIDPVTNATHAITVRSGIALTITDTAYVYEERRKSPPRWYKVLGWSETDDYITLKVRMVELSDQALAPQPNLLQAQPYQVEL